MKHDVSRQVQMHAKEHKDKRRWYKIFGSLSLVVVFCTICALTLPASTLEKGQCDIPEHTHDASCYKVETIENKTLVCTQEEGIQTVHTHTDECYDEAGNLICEQEETTEHKHTDDCYKIETETKTTDELICGKEEHKHDLSCYSDPKADVETEKDWKETFQNVEFSDDKAADLVAIAKTQVGYKESTKNYQVMEDGSTIKGYTRYGEWYEDPYGDWDAMFVSFCLHYAKITEIPANDDAGDWVKELKSESIKGFEAAGSYEPQIGDLVFFDTDKDDKADHVGILAEIQTDAGSKEARFRIIEGDVDDEVRYETYYESDPSIVGYGKVSDLTAEKEEENKASDTTTEEKEEADEEENPEDSSKQSETEEQQKIKQGNLKLVYPDGMQVPDGYDVQYSYIDPDNRFGVTVYAPEDALPADVVLTAELLEEGSEEYSRAEEALTDLTYDGLAAMGIHFMLDGEEVEPKSSVYVCINAIGLLPEGADEASLAVQHHKQPDASSEEEKASATTDSVTVETVADSTEKTGQVEVLENGDNNNQDVAAAFEVESFSTFTVTWQETHKLILHYVKATSEGTIESIYIGENETALATYSGSESVTLSEYANRISHSGYAYKSAYIHLNDNEVTVVKVQYNKDEEQWQYYSEDGAWGYWMDETNTADVYLFYESVTDNLKENEIAPIVPPENNVYPVDAINVWDENANVILVYPKHFATEDILANRAVNLSMCLENAFPVNSPAKDEWTVYRIENRNGRYQVLQSGDARWDTGVQVNDAYLLLVKKSYYIDEYHLYQPSADWDNWSDYDKNNITNKDGDGDTAQINWPSPSQYNNTVTVTSTGTPLAYITFSPKSTEENKATAAPRADDVAAVADSAIKFQLFDYSNKINCNDNNVNNWRLITSYFQFRGQDYCRKDLGKNQNTDRDDNYDQDGFTVNHATVERKLVGDYPVLDPNRDALGESKMPVVTKEDLPLENRSLAYLFKKGDHAVTAYDPINTILQKNGTHYYYNSAYNAVDYDINNKLFRVRNYVERNESTAGYSDAQKYYDFLPFNYTDGKVVGTVGTDARTYNLESSDVDYWFGMRMDVDFYQNKDGKLNGEEMVFNFSGDDDVWVFIDDVLVLDLGGTHGTVTGSINFATGKIEQYLDWNKETVTVGKNSFPTTIRACYEAANATPNGGWKGDVFADYTKHKLSFFYMERGCAVANCSLDFNLPTLPKESLQVAKELKAKDGADPDVVKHLENTMEYKFRVVKADANGNPTDDLLIKKKDEYTISGAGLSGKETREVGDGGYFTLKAGQMAEFTDMMSRFDANDVKKYVVQEVLPSDLTGQYHDVVYSIGSDTNSCKENTTTVETDFTGYNSPAQNADVGNMVKYTNKVETELLSTLAITKTQVGSSLNGEPEYYYMKVQLGPDANSLALISVGTPYFVGNETRYVETAGIIQLKAGETANIKLLAGTYYSVVEVADGNGTSLNGSEGYTPTYSVNNEPVTEAIGTVTEVHSTVNITVTNTFPTGDLELTKIVNNTAGGSTDGEFAFELKFPVESNWKDTNYTAAYTSTNSGQTHIGDSLSFTKQDKNAVATVRLYHGEKVTITGLPSGAQVSITETNSDGYSVGWKVNNKEFYGKTVDCSITKDSTATVTCTNTTGYELPDTGGTGTLPYTMGGLLITIIAGLTLLYRSKKQRREA